MIDYLEELAKKPHEKIFLYRSQIVIHFEKNPVYHSKLKYIKRRYHFSHRLVEEGDMCLKKMEGEKKKIQ